MNSSQQQVRKAPFIYPEYLSQMTAKMKPKTTRSELSAMNNGLLFPSQGLGETTNIDELKQTPSSSTSTTAGETTTSVLPPPKTQYHRRESGVTAASDPLPGQPLMYSSTNPMNRGMFMNQRMPNFNMSNAFSGGFSNLFSKKPFLQTPENTNTEASSQKGGGDDQSISSTRRQLFGDSPIMLVPTRAQIPEEAPSSSRQGSVTPSRKESQSPKKSESPAVSPKMQAAASPPAPPPASPFRNFGKALRMTAAGTIVMGSNSNSHSPDAGNTPPLSSNQSVASTISHFSASSQLSQSQRGDQPLPPPQIKVRDPPKIRVKLNNGNKQQNGLSPKRKCASCVCRDQKLVDQRKEIDHLKDVIQDLLVMGMESRASMNWGEDDDSLEDLPLPFILEEQAGPHEGDLIKAADMALAPSRKAFAVDPNDPLKTEQVSSTTAVLQMSHSLQVKQAFKRGAPAKIPEKIRHLRIQVNGNWGYYSGPKPEVDEQLVGCVVRFDNGDLYLGNMENSCFHGPGTYYPKGGRPFRGNFEWNQLSEYEC
ncbi:unnamed protein product [Cylindrotheca closterium]|uniref:Uncharacterized protein n=1 Tax=Cylindrotheca closterium TaxID=2856 RepID=A0AAD2JI49_9STRA|nr:unnamed protein product [Cylindrotheca closterium]